MSDYKYEMQLLAEERAEEEFGQDFYDLPPEKQNQVYSRAMTEWTERQYAKADMLKDQ